MPTGYTATLMEKGQDFRSFVLQCARAFGACIMQRDDPMTDPPKKHEPSSYYRQRIEEEKDKLSRLLAMDKAQAQAYGNALRASEIASRQKFLRTEREENARLEEMEEQVLAWSPPSTDHKGLKEFMLEQIEISKHDMTWAEKHLQEAKDKAAEEYFTDAVSGARRGIAYSEEGHKKGLERTQGRNEWIDQLYKSLEP